LKTHGGSMRYYISKKNKFKISERANAFFNKEGSAQLDNYDTYVNFKNNVEISKIKLVNLLKEIKNNNKKICGYAATSKSTTILNYCKIDNNLIDCIYDTTPEKNGLMSPGMHIPVKNFDNFYKKFPDYSFLFAWNHSKEIFDKEKDFSNSGGRWITHVPIVSVI